MLIDVWNELKIRLKDKNKEKECEKVTNLIESLIL